VWFLNFSTWTGRHGIYVEDLFVEPAVRGSGVALRLIRALATEAKAQGYARMAWAVLDWNEPAKGLLPAVGRPPQRDLGTLAARRRGARSPPGLRGVHGQGGRFLGGGAVARASPNAGSGCISMC
jgi:hypothetical protein